MNKIKQLVWMLVLCAGVVAVVHTPAMEAQAGKKAKASKKVSKEETKARALFREGSGNQRKT